MSTNNMAASWRQANDVIAPGWCKHGYQVDRLSTPDWPADNLSLLAETRDILQKMTTNLEMEAEKIGLKISAEKTKVMQIGGGRAPHPITVGQQNLDDVERFTYLGSVMTEDGGAEADVNCRVGKAASVFQCLRPIWTSCVVSTATKIWLYNSTHRGVCHKLRQWDVEYDCKDWT